MVDREARNRAAQLVQQVQDGQITGDELQEAWPRDSADAALNAVWDGLWAVAGRMGGSYEPTADGRALFERCVLFLRSDGEAGPAAALPEPPRPRPAGFRAGASLVLMLGAATPFALWGFSGRTAGVLMLWGLLWAWAYHLAEGVACRPPEGWSVGTVFWPFPSREAYEREQRRSPGGAQRQDP